MIAHGGQPSGRVYACVVEPLREMLRKPKVRRAALDTVAVVVAVVAGILAFSAAAQGPLTVGPAHLVISAAPASRARTVVEIPPFGTVSAPTHEGLLRLSVRVQEVDFVSAARMVEQGTLAVPQAAGPEAIGQLPVSGLATLLWRVIGGGLAAAALVGLLVALAFRRSRAVIAIAVALSVLIPGAVMGVAALTWDISAFRGPTLRGNLAYAPQLADIFSTRVASIHRLRDEASKVARNLAAYYSDERSLVSGGALPGTYRVLHVTDQHLDLVGAELARSIARSYETSLVIDTGDLPILGVQAEAGMFESLIDTTVARVYIPGNHDSPASVATLAQMGVTVLTSGTVEIDGLRILGVPDPIARDFGVEADPALIGAAAERAFAGLQVSLRSGEPTPDVVAIHNPLMEKPFVGHVPLIISGHTHAARLYVSRGTVRLNSGTLGGMPYDPASTGRKPLPYSASVLYFTADKPHRLIAVDRISVYPRRSTTVTREVIDESLLP